MEPDGYGGTQTGVIPWRITDCAFKVRPTGDSSSKGSHTKLLSVKLTCRWNCSCMYTLRECVVCWREMGGLRDLSKWYVQVHSSIVGRLGSTITLLLDSMMISICILWSDTCSPLLPLFWFPGLWWSSTGRWGWETQFMGMNVMLGIYTKYNEYLSVWLNVV